MTVQHPGYLRTAQVADVFHVSPKTVARWAADGKLPFQLTLGGQRRFPADEIRELADRLRVEPGQVEPTRWTGGGQAVPPRPAGITVRDEDESDA